jgi:hypothetical protein
MVRDGELMLCDGQSLVNGAGTFLSEGSFDAGTVDSMVAAFQSRGSPPHDVGRGKVVYLNVVITTDVDSAGDAATLKAEVITADDDALTSNVVTAAGGISAAIAQATLVAGYQFSIPVVLPAGLGTDQFYGLRFTVGVEAITAGTVDAWLSSEPFPRHP